MLGPRGQNEHRSSKCLSEMSRVKGACLSSNKEGEGEEGRKEMRQGEIGREGGREERRLTSDHWKGRLAKKKERRANEEGG